MLGDVTLNDAVAPDLAIPAVDAVPVTTGADANLRAAPGLNAEILGVAPGGTDLLADGISPDGGWLRVALPAGGPVAGAAWVNRDDLADPAVDDLPVMTRFSLTPLQAFTFQTGTGTPACMEAPPAVLVVQAPEGIPVDIIANGAPIRIEFDDLPAHPPRQRDGADRRGGAGDPQLWHAGRAAHPGRIAYPGSAG